MSRKTKVLLQHYCDTKTDEMSLHLTSGSQKATAHTHMSITTVPQNTWPALALTQWSHTPRRLVTLEVVELTSKSSAWSFFSIVHISFHSSCYISWPLTHFAPLRPSFSFLFFLTWQLCRGIKPDQQSSVMDEAGQESGVLICFQRLVKAFWMEKTDEGHRKKERNSFNKM